MAAVVVTTVGFLSSQAQSLFVVGQAIMVVALVVYIVEVLEDPEADEVELEVEEVVVDLINVALDNADTAEGNRGTHSSLAWPRKGTYVVVMGAIVVPTA